jgi:F-type H+-transporting ATPase subunit epsilon
MATRNTLHVEVVTAERELYNGEADIVDVPGSDGQLGILPEHAPLLALLGSGALEIKRNGEVDILFISGGFLEVTHDRVTILADTAENAAEIDEARAEEARRKAQNELQEAQTRAQRAEAEAALGRALFRLKIVELARRSGRHHR